jgi:hypothetical protein
MTDRPENTGQQPESQSTLGLVAEWLHISTPTHREMPDYTVLGYANGMVTLRDPRGKTEDNEVGKHIASKDGVFTMKIDDFARAFDEVLAARTKPMFDSSAIMIGRMPRLK